MLHRLSRSFTSNMTKKIGTHSGSFHCDEALACYMLQQHVAEFKDATIVRSREPSVLDECDIVVDVGGVYDVSAKRFDHHQRGFEHTFDDSHKTKLSSAGLVYKHYGREVIRSMTQCQDEAVVELIYQRTYNGFIEAIDGNDNGVNRYGDTKPLYQSHTSLPARVKRLGPSWNETGIDMDVRFMEASRLAGSELLQEVSYMYKSWLPARSIVEQALKKREEIHASGEILHLDHFCPWKTHLAELEEELGLEGHVKFVLFADQSGKGRVQAVSVSPDSFENRLSLPEPWCGVRDQKLSDMTGIKGCIFVHASGFIGGNATIDGALEMATKTLQLRDDTQ